jgi:hypothetical protein
MKPSRIFLGSILALATMGTAQAISLSDLFNGGSLTVGDKTFDSFSAVYSRSSTSTAPNNDFAYNWANIDVQTINDGGNLGLSFKLGDPLSATGDNWSNLFFAFHVSATSPNLINGVSLAVDGSFTNDNGGFNSYALWEYTGANLSEILDKANNGDSTVNAENGNFNISNLLTAGLAPRSDYYIGKNLSVTTSDQGQLATISSFEQRFNQTTNNVPEPSILLLFGTGLAGLAFSRRKSLQR